MPEASLKDWLKYIELNHSSRSERSLQGIYQIYKQITKGNIAKEVIIIGGTNGKGSTAEFLLNLLLHQEKKVGLYTSPHLFSFLERIRVNGEPIQEKDIVKSFKVVESNKEDKTLSYFDFITLAAFHHFSLLQLDYVILEVGVGGRLDPVNIIEPDISILTNIHLDHMNMLGSTKEKIAGEKADIFRKNKVSILGQKKVDLNVLKVLKRKAPNLLRLGEHFRFKEYLLTKQWKYNLLKFGDLEKIDRLYFTSLSLESASCALTAYCYLGYKLTKNDAQIINNTYLPCRREFIKNKILLDVCHNPASSRFLAKYINREFSSQRKIHAIIGVMTDKDVRGIINPLIPRISSWYATSSSSNRSMKTLELKETLIECRASEVTSYEKVQDALKEVLSKNSNDDIILICGSFLTVSDAKLIVQNLVK